MPWWPLPPRGTHHRPPGTALPPCDCGGEQASAATPLPVTGIIQVRVLREPVPWVTSGKAKLAVSPSWGLIRLETLKPTEAESQKRA